MVTESEVKYMPKHITKEIKEKIIKFYKQKPITIEELSKEFNISVPSILKILNEYKIKKYTKVQLFSPDLREDYFENIDNEFKAYFLGLIITDGCVHYTKGKQPLVGLTLNSKDDYLLNEFKKQIKSNKKITYDNRGCSEINILSRKMVEDLKKYGVIPNKSLKTIFPKNITMILYKDLIRGILDGDGSISFYVRKRRKSHTKAIRFCQGNKQFLEDLVEFFYKEIGIEKVNVFQERENLWSISYRKNDSLIKIINYIYDDAHIYMLRKKHLCDLIYNEIYNYDNTEITKSVTGNSIVTHSD